MYYTHTKLISENSFCPIVYILNQINISTLKKNENHNDISRHILQKYKGKPTKIEIYLEIDHRDESLSLNVWQTTNGTNH